MSWFRRHLREGRYSGDDLGEPGRPSRRGTYTDVPTSPSIVRFQLKPQMSGRLSAGTSRDEAREFMDARGDAAEVSRRRAEAAERPSDFGNRRAGPSPLFTYRGQTTTRDRDLDEKD